MITKEFGHHFKMLVKRAYNPASILHKSTAGLYQLVRVADGPITACYSFM